MKLVNMNPGRFKKLEDLPARYICCEVYREHYKLIADRSVYVLAQPAPPAQRACSHCGHLSPEQPTLWILSEDGQRIIPMPAHLIDVDEGGEWSPEFYEHLKPREGK